MPDQELNVPTENKTPDNNQNKSSSKSIAALALIIATVTGVATFLENIDKIQSESRKFCQFLSICRSDPLTTPSVPGFVTDWMGGGSNQSEQCDPLLRKYQAENPNFNITRSSSEERKKTTFGNAQYKYHCNYVATQK